MVPPLSVLSLALCHEVLEGGGYQQIRKKKLPLLLTPFAVHCLTKATAFVPQCEIMEPSKWSRHIRKKKLPLLLTTFAIHCLTKAAAFVPQCKTMGPEIGAVIYAKRNFPSCSLCSQFTASQKPPLLFPNAKQWGQKLEPCNL